MQKGSMFLTSPSYHRIERACGLGFTLSRLNCILCVNLYPSLSSQMLIYVALVEISVLITALLKKVSCRKRKKTIINNNNIKYDT